MITLTHHTQADLCATTDPSLVPAQRGVDLSDRQLMQIFEQICAATGVSRWTSPHGPHFDVAAEDVRTELRRLLWRGGSAYKLDLQHALRVIAWAWERECLTE